MFRPLLPRYAVGDELGNGLLFLGQILETLGVVVPPLVSQLEQHDWFLSVLLAALLLLMAWTFFVGGCMIR